METNTFLKIFSDKNFYDYKKMNYKYPDDFAMCLDVMDKFMYTELPLLDFEGNRIVYLKNRIFQNYNYIKYLSRNQSSKYPIQNTESEIISTSKIENIDFDRKSVRRILNGMSPQNEDELRINGIKKSLDFICELSNKINEENIYKLYMTLTGEFLAGENKLLPENLYRHDEVYIVSNKIEHRGLNHKKIPQYMKSLVEFVNDDDDIDDLTKAAIIHFYIAYIHPYFDGNGRMARLMHLWYLISKGYQSTLFTPFSSAISDTRSLYYGAFTQIEENKEYTKKIDITPFIDYFAKKVFTTQNAEKSGFDTIPLYDKLLSQGVFTPKETELWNFVLSYYGKNEFSTKQLEKDFGNAAYATIRQFVMKFEKCGLLAASRYGARIKYNIV